MNGTLSGLDIVLHTRIGEGESDSAGTEIRIPHKPMTGVPGLHKLGLGYWEISLKDIVSRPDQTEPLDDLMFQRSHAIAVSLSKDALEQGLVRLDEQIHVRLFIFVNALRK